MDARLDWSNDALFELAERVLPGAGLGGYALPEDIRFVFAEGAGARLRDVEGREYIDYVGGAGALILGHSHPAVVAAAQEQVARGLHMFGTLNAPAIRLAARLVESVQRGLRSRGYRPGPLVVDPRGGVNSEHSIKVLQQWMREAIDGA